MKRKIKIMPIFFLLVLLIELNIVFSSAKYSSSSTGNSKAKVAKFEVETVATNDNTNYEISDTNTEAIYNFTLKNRSDVSVKYEINVMTPSELPNGIDVKLIDKNGIEHTPVKDGQNYIFSEINVAGAKEENAQNFNLKFIVSNNAIIKDDIDLNEIRVKASAVQID